MRVSVSLSDDAPDQAPFVFKGSVLRDIEKAAEIGYEAVELHIRDPEKLDDQALIHTCNEQNIQVSSIGTGLGYGMDGLSLSSENSEVRKDAVNRLKSHIILAGKLNCLVIIGLMKGQIKDSGGVENYEQNVGACLKECIRFAEMHQVLIVLEAINRYESDTLNTIKDTVDFIDKFNTNYLKLHIDTFHMNMEENSIVQSVIEAKDYIGHVHAADNNRMYPGNGFFDFKTFIDVLKMIDYKGDIALECLSLPTPDEAAKKARSYLITLIE